MQGLPIATWLKAPTWLRNPDGPGFVWPVGLLDAEGHAGVVVVGLADTVSIKLIDSSTQVFDGVTEWPRADAFGGMHEAPIRRALLLAEAMCGQLDATIGYQKHGADAAEPRRIGRIVPSSDGAGIVCADLDKDAPRRFNCHRITSVELAPSTD